MYKRALLAFVVIALAATTAASAAVLLKVDEFVQILRTGQNGHEIKIKPDTLTKAKAGDAQTILVLGSDRRFTDPKSAKGFKSAQPARSDTIMLLHMDPNAAATTVLSIPRDLKVQIPGHGVDKINAAYSIGGPDLVARTVKQLLGPEVKINHVVNVNFHSFQLAVNYLKGVYVDVDQFYYHSNAGLAQSQFYSEIDIKPGYQKLVGSDALAYVRYRHTDSDFIRADRQQDFLREAKNQFGQSRLFKQFKPLVKIFSRYTQTDKDLESVHAILQLILLMAYSTKHPVQQVTFPAGADVNTPLAQYVTVDSAAVPTVVRQFLHPVRVVKASAGKTKTKAKSTHASPATKQGKAKARAKAKLQHKHAKASGLAPGLVAAKAEMGNAMAPVIAHQEIDFPAYIPGAILAGTHLASYTSPAIENPYPYKIYDRNIDKRHPRGRPHSAYRFVIAANLLQGGYYGVQGTDWKNPPLLAHPTKAIVKDGRRLLLYTNGGKLRFVAWKTPRAEYWVSNTLDYELTNQQMIGIARSLTRFG